MSDQSWRVPELFKESSLRLAPDRMQRLRMFHVELLKFNEKLNLISKASVADSDILHVWDACLFATRSRKALAGYTISDLGSGNGIPGIIGAILNPDIHWNLYDTDQRKCAFLRHIRHTLGLSNLTVTVADVAVHEFSKTTLAVSRGFKSLIDHIILFEKNPNILSQFSGCLCMKGPGGDDEIAEAIKEKGSTWNISKVDEYKINFKDEQLVRQTVCISAKTESAIL